MVRQMANYRPRHIHPTEWRPIEWYVREVIALTSDPRHKDPMAHVHVIARFIHWAHVYNGRPLDHASIFERRLIVAFTESVFADRSTRYVATERARLLGAARALNKAERALPVKKRADVANPPYSRSQMDHFVHLAGCVKSPYGRRSVSLIVTLSAGAGLNATDYIRLRNRHVEVSADPGGGVVVDVPDSCGTARTSLRPRRVPVHASWEGRVRALMSDPGLDPDAFVVWENVTETRENLQALTQGMRRAIAERHERPVIARLRTTWIVEHLRAGVPVPDLVEAAGTHTAESLFRYVPFVERSEPGRAQALLRGLPR